jgi:hypothetical protein
MPSQINCYALRLVRRISHFFQSFMKFAGLSSVVLVGYRLALLGTPFQAAILHRPAKLSAAIQEVL